jgi:tripartite-type tricarboxylate transporter receptor subunit TctC
MPGLRALAVAGETRSLVRPGTPTFREQVIELVTAPCFGLGLIAAAPERIRKELAEYLAALMANPAVRERFLALGFTPLDPAGAAGTAGFFAEQRDFAVKALEDYPLIPKDQRRKPTGRTIAPASGPAP